MILLLKIIFYFRGAHSPLVFHVKENIAGATVGQIFPVNVSSLQANNTGNIRFIIANQQDVTDDIAIGKINFVLIFIYRKTGW